MEVPNLNTINTQESEAVKDPVLETKVAVKNKKWLKVLVSIFSVLLIVVAVVGVAGFFLIYVPGKQLWSQVNMAKIEANELKVAVSEKDLTKAQQGIDKLKLRLATIEMKYKNLSYFGVVPKIKDYYADGNQLISMSKEGLEAGEIVIKAVAPYQDFLGLKGGSTDAAKTTEDRIAFLTESVEGLVPYMDTIEAKVAKIEDSLQKIDPQRYPDEFRGMEVKSNILKAKQLLADGHKLIKDGKPMLTKTSWLLGKDKPRTYLIIFQNDAELRPTGGFWTAYAIVKVDNGKITPVVSDDIYTLDAKLNSTIPAPRPIKAYHINVPYYNLRDMNISPDFPTSAKIFLDNYTKIMGRQQNIDAVIALDTQVLVDIVKVIGRVGVSGYGNFSADPDKRCDGCPQIIYQLEWIAGRPRNYIETDRKGFLGPLMNSLLSNAMGSEKNKIGPLAEGALTNIFNKHVLFYFTDSEIQQAAELANIAGKIIQTDSNVDYMHLNDANMSSAKTNLFLKQKIKHEIISKDGKVNHKITVTYTNPSKASNCNLERGDLCLNAPKYRNWFRFYVPAGSKLVKMTGSEVDGLVYEELGKQVFEGFYGNKYPLYAQSSVKTSVQYESSVPASDNYSLLLQKQAGTKAMDYELWVNGRKQESFDWTSDKTIKLSLR